MEWIDYREKLGLNFKDDEQCTFCTSLILNHISDYAESKKEVTGLFGYFDSEFDLISNEEYRTFCENTGTQYGNILDSANRKIYEILETNTASFKSFISYYMALVNCVTNRPKGYEKQQLLNILDTAFQKSRLRYSLIKDDNDYFVFPSGVKEFDTTLVSEPLEWLKSYPMAHKTYITALKQYADGEYIRDCADNLRKALEAFLQEFLGNNKNLETNKNKICKYLGDKGVDAGITGLFQPLINAYKNINDRIAKHNDAVDERLLEFLLYQTGILIRMVLTIKQSESEVSNNAD